MPLCNPYRYLLKTSNLMCMKCWHTCSRIHADPHLEEQYWVTEYVFLQGCVHLHNRVLEEHAKLPYSKAPSRESLESSSLKVQGLLTWLWSRWSSSRLCLSFPLSPSINSLRALESSLVLLICSSKASSSLLRELWQQEKHPAQFSLKHTHTHRLH